ncbi:hypothetical protein WN093_09790 [Gammaproteobacteria bacterium AS21]
MNTIQTLTNDRLQKLIDETQHTLNELKQEVTRRKALEQEHQIMDLENHMKSAELSLTTIKNFIDFLVKDSKSK